MEIQKQQIHGRKLKIAMQSLKIKIEVMGNFQMYGLETFSLSVCRTFIILRYFGLLRASGLV